MNNPYIEKAVNYLNDKNGRGGQAKLARLIKTTSAFVSQMKTGKRKVPGELSLPIQRATDGVVTAHELNPKLYPSSFINVQKPTVQPQMSIKE